jgi:Fe-S cluster biogenesis protein NfuA
MDREIHSKLLVMLAALQPIFQAEGGQAQLLSVQDGVARIAFGSGCSGCDSGPAAMTGGLRLTLLERIPGLKDVIFE